MISNKIVRYENSVAIKKLIEGKKTVLIGGCFDILHYGHLRFLSQAKECGEVLAVALEPDEFIRKIKNKKPIHTQEQRAEILAHLDLVDVIILLPLFTEKDYYDMVQVVHPQVIALTKGDPHLAEKSVQAKKVGAEIVQIDFMKGYSSSYIQQYGT
ncbi:adenylyltransferase/cytidyltransferase family protein [Candidatus Roizmanbacteria bacterium]|nr:adenylyltransferase/cytidyltransferase family protein [Candidatus Roizmanbacteria bacterium]